MLLAEERVQAVDILVKYEMNKGYDYGQMTKQLLIHGVTGFSTLKDEELMRMLSKISKAGNWEAQNFIGNIMIDKIILGNS